MESRLFSEPDRYFARASPVTANPELATRNGGQNAVATLHRGQNWSIGLKNRAKLPMV